MNSDVNSNEDVLYEQFLNWLLQKSDSDDSSPKKEDIIGDLETKQLDSRPEHQKSEQNNELVSGVATNNLERSETMNQFSEPSFFEHDFVDDPLDWEEDIEIALFESNNPDLPLGETKQQQTLTPSANPVQSQSLEMKNIPLVEQRFQEIIKRKIRSEIEQSPLLFPWENNISEYESEAEIENPIPEFQKVPRVLWIPQLVDFLPSPLREKLLPIPLSEKLLLPLLESCLEVLQSSLRQSAKVKRVVGQLFPEQEDIVSNLVMSPTRDTQQLENFLKNSQGTTPQEQMVLSIFLSRKVFDNLTLIHTRTQPVIKRQWMTTAGLITIHSEYCFPKLDTPNSHSPGSVRIRVQLPQRGTVKLQTPTASTITERVYPGQVSLELVDWEPKKYYPVEICLSDSDQTPLIFMVNVDDSF